MSNVPRMALRSKIAGLVGTSTRSARVATCAASASTLGLASVKRVFAGAEQVISDLYIGGLARRPVLEFEFSSGRRAFQPDCRSSD